MRRALPVRMVKTVQQALREHGQDGVQPRRCGWPGWRTRYSGLDGLDGQDGVSIASAEVNSSGELVIVLSDGTSITGFVDRAHGCDRSCRCGWSGR